MWIDNPSLIKDLVQNYFKELFRNQDDTPGNCLIMNPHNALSVDDNEPYVSPYLMLKFGAWLEVSPHTRPPALMGFKLFFTIPIGEDICNFVKICFANNAIPKEVNRTLIALIPKSDNPDTIKMFRPISLCNVRYKIVTKILVAGLRPLLGKIISSFQGSFIPGRSTNDNIIITQEILHTLRSKKGKKGGMLLKIDLEKAYDKISWKFLLDTLIFFNLNPDWTALIMSCVSNVRTSILWNGESLDDFSPGRGLRQRDPL